MKPIPGKLYKMFHYRTLWNSSYSSEGTRLNIGMIPTGSVFMVLKDMSAYDISRSNFKIITEDGITGWICSNIPFDFLCEEVVE